VRLRVKRGARAAAVASRSLMFGRAAEVRAKTVSTTKLA
jgi:hypothetical protein